MQQQTPQELLAIINKALEAIQFDKQPNRLYDPIRYTLDLGGKRIRPVMCLMACELFGKEPATAMPAALALEMFHNFTLLHDDIMDKAEKRRNRDCVHIKWNDNVAILSGDAMQIMAMDFLRGLPDGVFRESVAIFNRTAIEVCEGQQYDMDFEAQDHVCEADYLNMIRLKTGVLLAASLKLGALAAGASREDAQRLYDMGLHIGIAFQLQDDLLDVYGDPATFGKNIGGDITSNKKTYLLIMAQKRADQATRAELEGWLTNTQAKPCEKIAAVTAIYNRTNAKEACQKVMEEHYQLALEHMAAVSAPATRKEPLLRLAASLMNRNN